MGSAYQKIFKVACFFVFVLSAVSFGFSKPPEPVKQPVNPVLNQLDLDGDLVLFLNTETVEQSVLTQIDAMSQLMLSSMPDSEATTQVLDGFARLKAGLEWSGLLSLDSFGISMKPVDGTLNRVIEVIQYAEEDGQKPLWRVCFSEPKPLKGIDFVPSNCVYAVNGTFSLNEAWRVAMEAVDTYCSPDQVAGVEKQIALVQMMLGTNISAVAESVDDEVLIALQLSETKELTLPGGGGADGLTIPEPSLLIGLKTKNPLLGQILLNKMAQAQMPVAQSEHGEFAVHTLNMPAKSPFPFQPTLAMNDEYLIIGSTQAVVVRAIDCQKNKNGLASTPLYTKVLQDAPEKVSSIAFVSPRFMQVYMDVIGQSASAGQPEVDDMFDIMLGGYKNMYMGGYSLKIPTGLYFKGYADYGGAKPVEMLSSAYTGMLSAVAIPSIMNAYAHSHEKAKARNIAEVEKAKGILTLPQAVGLPGAMGLTDQSLPLDTGEAKENLMKALNISDLSELDVGNESIVVGTLSEKAFYRIKQ